ncbi:MAG TPA: hypothetical protein GX708_13525 [Gallicola sp.]|nr:hypothetical protein [Gallicola sp.]
MDIKQLESSVLDNAVAYMVGLTFPLYKTILINGKEYIVGSVNHNSNMISHEDLASHYKIVLRLLAGKNVKLLANQNEDQNISSKKGFSVLIEKTGVSNEECLQLLLNVTKKISRSSVDLKKEFARACFDGRSSWDTTAHYLSIDVDRDYNRQDAIIEIIESIGIEINVNRREINHQKNDQIRIKKNSIDKFMSEIGLYSFCRTKLINQGLKNGR